MMVDAFDLNDFDKNVVKNLNEYGKKIKKYELIQLLKRDFACSELEINQSLVRLLGYKIIKKTESNEYLLTDF